MIDQRLLRQLSDQHLAACRDHVAQSPPAALAVLQTVNDVGAAKFLQTYPTSDLAITCYAVLGLCMAIDSAMKESAS